VTDRPEWIPEDWLRFTRGYELGGEIPAAVPGAFDDPDPWIRLVAITLAAKNGDFTRVDDLVEIAIQAEDDHLREAAIRVFAQAASPSSLGQLSVFFDHPEYSTRTTAYLGATMSCHLPLARALAMARVDKDSDEQLLIEIRISVILEELTEADFVQTEESKRVSDRVYLTRVERKIQDIEFSYGPGQAIYFGSPLDVFAISGSIRSLCDDDDANDCGGIISDMLDLLEGMVGFSVLGCVNDEVEPVLPKIHAVLAQMRREPKLLQLLNGTRPFFCRPVA